MAEENVPQSGAPDFNKLELEVLKFWQDNKIFEKSLEQTKSGTPYVFYDGPPFATGTPHHGSLLSSIIKDLVGRYQTMQGRYVRRRWGWDCHGLPIENIVEQNLKISGKKQIEELGVERFNKVCRDNVLKYVEEWGKFVTRVGRWVEFENSYKTMDNSYMESVWWALKQTWEKGLIYEDRKVLLYCSRCETPISNFEVAMDNSYRDVTEESVYVKFKLPKGQRIINDLTNDKTYALAWTTTPWTLPGNTALNIGPEIEYVMVEAENGERYILAKERLSVLEGAYETVMEFPARALEGLEYEPLYPGVIQDEKRRAHHIYAADFVTTTDGTGIVHNAAMYGEEDYQLAKEKDLPRQDMLDHKGQYLPTAPENLRGVFFKDADKIILTELKEKGLVYKTQSYTHSYPHCHRCGTPLFYNALPAWFINIQRIKPDLLKNNEEINWYPDHLKYGRFAKSAEQAPDWNISRNRYWATPLPFWKCIEGSCGNVSCIGSVGELRERSINFAEVYPNFSSSVKSSEASDLPNAVENSLQAEINNLQLIDLHRPYIDRVKLKCEKCGGEMQRISEVVDCWVESGSMPFAELHAPFENTEVFEQRFPADFVAEYIPQTRAWFYVMHVMSTVLFNRAPFKNVVTTGNVLAEDGSKMSKSKKNYPDPWMVFEKYGVDALRFYLLASPVMNAEDLNFSEKGVQEVGRKVNMILYNVWSFYRMYQKQHISMSADKVVSTHILDRWVLARLSETHKAVTEHLNGYDTVRSGRAIVEFINDLSTWYVRRSRERMKETSADSEQALNTLGAVLVETAKLLAPFMPYLADFLYKDLTGKESVHLETWTAPMPQADSAVLESMQTLRDVVESGLALRKESTLKVRQPLAELHVHFKKPNQLPDAIIQILAEELNVKKVSVVEKVATEQGWIQKDTPTAELALYTVLTEELKQEGLAREIERAVQDLRKKSGLKVGDLVDVYYNTQDEKLEDVFLRLFDRKKTFVSQIQKSLDVEVDFEIQAKVEGSAIWIGMNKI